ncbi:MAG TPA: ABC transporter ATP-binding protein [Candidatus Dormibacteraeota bacterium]|nr:ABC transporter ATP-binding protein [Candidatus Dormibacteraeota bacterium]
MTEAPGIVAPAPEAGGTDGNGPFVEIRDVVKVFPLGGRGGWRRGTRGIQAVSGVSFSIARGETVALVGESGSGKTTLGRIVVALETATSGSVLVDGVALAALPPRELRSRRRAVQLVFQDSFSSLDPRMRIAGIVDEPMRIQGSGTAPERRARVEQLVSEVGLPGDVLQRFPHELSGGQRQRVALARALALEPRLVVADEPVSALDMSVRAQIVNLMRGLQQTRGLTYLVVSHDLAVVRSLARRTAVMYLGKLVEIGPTATVLAAPAHPYTAGLISVTPVPDPRAERRRTAPPPAGEAPSAADPPSGCRYRTRCPRATPLCSEEEPPLRRFGVEHLAACHVPLRAPDPATN